MSKTDENLADAFSGGSRANRKYIAFAIKATEEGSPEIAQLFMEAAGAETTHALNHLKVMRIVKSTKENIREAAEEENYEIEEMYPRFIKEARSEGREDAAKSFELTLEREKHHREMFREALKKLAQGLNLKRVILKTASLLALDQSIKDADPAVLANGKH